MTFCVSDIVVAVEGFGGNDPTGGFQSLDDATKFAAEKAKNILADIDAGRFRYFWPIAVVVRTRWGAKHCEFARFVCKAVHS